MGSLGVEWLCEIGAPPPQLVSLAADADCRYVSATLRQVEYNPFGYPAWSLFDDPALTREMKARMADRGVSIGLGEGCLIAPGVEVLAYKRDLDLFRELGAVRINTVSVDPDRQRTFDQFCRLAEMARDVDLELTVEFVPFLTIANMDEAADLLARAAQPNAKMLVDVMHFARAGHTAKDIARHDPSTFGYVQVCDGPLRGEENYMDEAMNNRMIPGEGEMPVADILAALPKGLIVSMEVPLKRLAETGMTAAQRIGRTAAATRALMSAIPA